jgi:hypothetical protein
MSNYLDSSYTALNNLRNVYADIIETEELNVKDDFIAKDANVENLTVTNSITYPEVFTWNNLINQPTNLNGTNQLIKTNFSNNITQTNGSNTFLDSTVGTITQRGNSVIVQSGEEWNYLKQTQVTDLEILGSVTLPSDITIAGSSYTDDLTLLNSTIQQTTNPGQINTLCATDFYSGDVRMSNNLTMIGGAGTIATLKNLIVEGTSQLAIITGTTITDIYNSIALKANINSPTFTGTVSGITKAMVGLGNVDNTSDVAKPVSTATTSALNLKANLASPTFTGTVGGITKTMVGLSNVDNTTDLLKPISTATQTALDLKANLASPTFSGIATFSGSVSGVTKVMVGLPFVDNTSDVNKPVSTATSTALSLKTNLQEL